MDRFGRREFLGRALLAGVGATVFQPFAERTAAAEGSETALLDIDPGFAAGSVVDVKTGLLSLVDQDSVLRILRLSPQSQLWKEGLWNQLSLAVGDCIYARGELDNENALQVDRLWVDIKSFSGSITSLGETELTLTLPDGVAFPVRLLDRTEVETSDGQYISGTTAALQTGQQVQIVGFGDPIQTQFTATKILLASSASTSSTVADDVFDPPAPDDTGLAQCPYTYKGLATWFCCGGVSGCGKCGGGTSGGSCGNCRADRLHMAWPKITNPAGNTCNYTCGHSCNDCCASLPQLNCDKLVDLRNPCNNNSVADVRVRDCGPCVHCSSPFGCKDRTRVKFDLTPCAFTRLGNLDNGKVTCNATVFLRC